MPLIREHWDRADVVDGVATEVVPLPLVDGEVAKVEGLMVVESDRDAIVLRAVVDVDDHRAPSLSLRLRVSRLAALAPQPPS